MWYRCDNCEDTRHIRHFGKIHRGMQRTPDEGCPHSNRPWREYDSPDESHRHSTDEEADAILAGRKERGTVAREHVIDNITASWSPNERGSASGRR